MIKNRHIAAATASLLLSGAAGPVQANESSTAEVAEIVVESPMEQIADQLTGTWMTNEPIESRLDDNGNTIDIAMLMSITPVTIEGMDNTAYVESSLSNTPWTPFRQAIFQLYEYKGKVRLRTYTMAISEDALGVYTGMGAAPAHFPSIDKDQLIATLDVELEVNGSGFSGSTPYPYPTGVSGAVEMTSSVTFDGTTLTTADRGYDADGNVAWGAGEDASYAFVQVDPYAVLNQRDDGLAIIDYPASGSDMVVQEGDEMHVHYSGFLSDGMMFDSSYGRGVPFTFRFPPGNRAIVGWGLGMEGLSKDAHRKLIIPGDLGYGPGGNPRANIPGDATLIFNIFLAHLDRPEPVEEPAMTETHDESHDHAHDEAHSAED